jgi:hypothetical protein
MTQSLKTSPKTSQRPLFLRKRGFLTHKKGGKPPKIPGAVAYRGNLFQKKFTGKERDSETGLYGKTQRVAYIMRKEDGKWKRTQI